MLTEAALGGWVDDLQGLKENVILGHLIPAGSGFRRYQNMRIKQLGEPIPLIPDLPVELAAGAALGGGLDEQPALIFSGLGLTDTTPPAEGKTGELERERDLRLVGVCELRHEVVPGARLECRLVDALDEG